MRSPAFPKRCRDHEESDEMVDFSLFRSAFNEKTASRSMSAISMRRDADRDPSGARTCEETRRHPTRSANLPGRVSRRRHGGASGSGAQRGNRNAWQHGEYSSERKAELQALPTLLTELGSRRTLPARQLRHGHLFQQSDHDRLPVTSGR